MEYTFSALSSNKTDLYKVNVFEVANQIGISCDCPATVLCKHRVALITGNTDSIFPTEFNNPLELEAAVKLIRSSGLPDKFDALNSELEEIKQEFKRQEKGIRRQLSALCVPKG
ncbi:TPA: hypothetical protein U5D43_002838 [Yersinia enterocolitica]|nr:hypothetical protein [Yersinia enterocolitica]HEN3245911.1 hypothetical protein [Yersinia enterocolitica]